MPVSSFSEGLQKVISFLPGTYGTSLLRNHFLEGAFEEMSGFDFPAEVVEAIRDSVDCNIYFFEEKVEITEMYMVMAGSVIVLTGLYILLNILSGKKQK